MLNTSAAISEPSSHIGRSTFKDEMFLEKLYNFLYFVTKVCLHIASNSVNKLKLKSFYPFSRSLWKWKP